MTTPPMADAQPPVVRTVVYSFVVADLLHYGHLQLLQTAKQLGDFHICGVLTDDAAASYRARPITNFDERVAIVSNMRVVDRVMAQERRDPTENLKRVRAEYPDAELVLVHGNDWKEIPGRAFVESVGGRVVQPEYYRRLSDSHIRQELAQASPGGAVHYEAFTEHFRIDHLHVFEADQRPFVLSTKANTLRALAPLVQKSRIEPMLTFRVAEWGEKRPEIVARIRKAFGPGRVVVRSSAINEDTYHRSQAGCFESRVNVPTTPRGLAAAIDAVVASYPAKGNGNPLNQVLVQPHTPHVRTSGVVFTREPRSGGAYYVINYDDRTGSTESVTSGVENQALDVAHQCPPARWPEAWRGLLEAVREVEAMIPGTPLDIEFAIDRRGAVVIFQVRPLAVGPLPSGVREAGAQMLAEAAADVTRWSAPVAHLAGATNIFSDMAFWNPAEIIGDRPKALAESLYRHVIMDAVWHEALAPLGYTAVGPAPLMRCFGGKPYVDFRATVNALLPAGLSKALRHRLVRDAVTRLRQTPELHDKIEFAIVDNCWFFTLDAHLASMRRRGFSERDTAAYRAGLVGVTNRAFAYSDRIEAEVAHSAAALAKARARAMATAGGSADAGTLLKAAAALLDNIRDSGTRPFSLMARLAFIGKRLLRSVVERGWMSERDYDAFMDHVRTVATEISEDDAAVTAQRLNR
ncbi:MAG: adenylyltransferase/cytidyltransferase family protein, partial [Acidimicrobiia bacterium]|nr:adenylyltransferase/cytidyltransferase family protein [Acidimicrobiia bacterium]